MKHLRLILQNMMFKPKIKAFTLLEVLLALFITAVLAALLSVVFNTGLRAYRKGKDLIEITKKAQLIMGQITRELPGAMVQEVSGATIIPFIGNADSIYFMAPVDNSSDVDLCEIGYIRDGSDNTIDKHFLTADAGSGYQYPTSAVVYKTTSGGNEPGATDELCDNVTGFTLQYYDSSDSTWYATWSDAAHSNRLPEMVEVVLTVQGDYGSPRQTKTFTTWIYLENAD